MNSNSELAQSRKAAKKSKSSSLKAVLGGFAALREALLIFFLSAALAAPALAASSAVAPAAPPKPPPPEPMDTTPLPANAGRIGHGRFSEVDVYKPQGTPSSFVLLLSDEAGWTPRAVATAQALVQKNAMVAGIDLPRFRRMLEAIPPPRCEYIAGDFENLSHFVQAYYKLPDYLPPIVVGLGAGGALGYAEVAEGPTDSSGGALLLGFKPGLKLRKPLCPGWALATDRSPDNQGLDMLAAKAVAVPVTLFSDAAGEAATKVFASQLGQGTEVTVDQGAAGPSQPFLDAFDKLAASLKPSAPAAPADLGGLPVIEVPAKAGVPGPDAFAILISGDGGWAGLDQAVAGALSAQGIPVVGVDSLRYFWTARTPESTAADIDRIVRYYLNHLHKNRVLLLGYSQGADVMPFIVSRLPPETRKHVALGAVMGLSEHALFEFHVGNWVNANQDQGLPTAPEMEKPGGIPMLCIYGDGETDTLCPKLDPQKVKVVKLPGGHHFGGDYQRLAREILGTANLPTVAVAAASGAQTSAAEGDQSSESKEEGSNVNMFHLWLTPLASLIAGILILVMPRLLNYIVAIYLIVIGVLGLLPHLQLH
jgi:type IV secretory pathway VirJ component